MAEDAKKDAAEKPADQKQEISDTELEKVAGGMMATRSGGGGYGHGGHR